MNSIGRNIKRLRVKNNMTQDRLAEIVFVSRQTISNWELGKSQPDMDTLSKLADIFNTDIYELIYGNKKDEYPEFQRKYLIRVIVAVLLVFLALILKKYLVPYLYTLSTQQFRYRLEQIFCSILLDTLLFFALGFFITNFISCLRNITTSRAKLLRLIGVVLMLPIILLLVEYIRLIIIPTSNAAIFTHITVNDSFKKVVTNIFPLITGLLVAFSKSK